MATKRDHTDIPQTCPLIDAVIRFIGSIEWDEDEKYLVQQAIVALDKLEAIRKHNSDLRDFGNEQYRRAEEAEAEVHDLKKEIEQLESELNEIVKQ